MAFLTAEDQNGFVEIICFSDIYGQKGSLLKEEEPLLFHGTVDQAEESTKVILSDCELLAEGARRDSRRLHLRLLAEGLSIEQLKGLKALLNGHSGPLNVMIHLEVPGEGEVVLSLNENICTSAEQEQITTIQELMGPQWIGNFLE